MHKLRSGLAVLALGLAVATATAVAVPTIASAAPVANLLANGSVETPNATNANLPASWTTDTWGKNTAAFSYLSTGFDGARSVKVTLSNRTSGDGKWVPDPVAVTAGTVYTWTEQYEASVATHVVYDAINASGVETYNDVVVTVPASASAVKTLTATITPPAGTVKLTVLHLLEKNGWLQTDNATLTAPGGTPPPPPPPPAGLVPNGSVETPNATNANLPASWAKGGWGTNTRQLTYVSGDGSDGTHSVKACITKYGTDQSVSGDANWESPQVPLTAAKDYRATFSYKVSVPTGVNVTAVQALHNVHVVAHYVKADGSEDFFGLPDPEPTADNATAWTAYSDVFNVPPDVVSADVILVMRGLGCVSLDNLQLAPYTYTGFDTGRVILTFDDAPDVDYANALPVLNQYGFKGTLYLPTHEGTYAPGWIEGNPTMENYVKAFAGAGFEIGAHTVSHPDLTTLPCPGTQLTTELKHPQDYLRTLTGQPITDFASPYGAYNACVNQQIAGYYGSHRTTDEGYNSRDNFNALRLRVQNLTPTTPLSLYQYWVNKAAADHTTLILVYHNVDDPANAAQNPPDDFDTMLPDFKAQMAFLAGVSGVKVERMDTALTEMKAQL